MSGHTLTVTVHHGDHRATESFTLDFTQSTQDEIRADIVDALDYCYKYVDGIGRYLPMADDRRAAIADDLMSSDAPTALVEAGWARVTLTD